MNKQKRGSIFVISGPSGSGKTTLVERIVKDKALKDKLCRSVSLTTRPQRSGEKEGRDYFFLTRAQFKKLLEQKKILEWTRYLEYYYGTPTCFLQRQLKKGKNLILCLDLKGAFKIKRFFPKETSTIFILPPSIEALYGRIRNRCHKTGAREINRRIQVAKKEIALARRYDYCLVNQDLKRSTKELKQVILNKINN